jgi:hypothetical protein
MDLVDGAKNVIVKWRLARLQVLSGFTGLASAGVAFWAALATEGGATVVAGLSLTVWGLVLAVALVALAMAIDRIRGDNLVQWLERSYWGALEFGRYTDPMKEQTDFTNAMTGS